MEGLSWVRRSARRARVHGASAAPCGVAVEAQHLLPEMAAKMASQQPPLPPPLPTPGSGGGDRHGRGSRVLIVVGVACLLAMLSFAWTWYAGLSTPSLLLKGGKLAPVVGSAVGSEEAAAPPHWEAAPIAPVNLARGGVGANVATALRPPQGSPVPTAASSSSMSAPSNAISSQRTSVTETAAATSSASVRLSRLPLRNSAGASPEADTVVAAAATVLPSPRGSDFNSPKEPRVRNHTWAVRWLSLPDADFGGSSPAARQRLPGCPPLGSGLCEPHHVFGEVLVLTLPRRRERWLRLSQQLRRLRVPHTLVHGYDSAAPGFRAVHKLTERALGGGKQPSPHSRRPADLALLASVADVFDYLRRSPLESVLLLGDNALLLDAGGDSGGGFAADFDRQARLLPRDWRQFFLGATLPAWDNSTLADPALFAAADRPGARAPFPVRRAWGIFAVAWHRSVAGELADLLQGKLAPVVADVVHAVAARYPGKSLVAWPFLAVPDVRDDLDAMTLGLTGMVNGARGDERLAAAVLKWDVGTYDLRAADVRDVPLSLLGGSLVEAPGHCTDGASNDAGGAAAVPPGWHRVPCSSGGTALVPQRRGARPYSTDERAQQVQRWIWPGQVWWPAAAADGSTTRHACPPPPTRRGGALCRLPHVFSEVLVLTLPRRRNRWLRLSQQLRKHGVPHTLVHGYDGKSRAWRLLHAATGGLDSGGRLWQATELAVYATHVDVLDYLRRSPHAALLLLEDDAQLLNDDAFAAEFDRQMRQLPRRWEQLYLGASIRRWDASTLVNPTAVAQQIRAGGHRPFGLKKAFGAFAIGWVRRAAAPLLQSLARRPLPLDRLATAHLAAVRPRATFAFWPFLVIPDVSDSDLRSATKVAQRRRYANTRWRWEAHNHSAPDVAAPLPLAIMGGDAWFSV